MVEVKSNYQTAGLQSNISDEVATTLTDAFLQAQERPTVDGYFLGVQFLEQLVKDLTKGKFDGLLVKFGIDEETNQFVLVATQQKLKKKDSLEVKKQGIHYASIGGNSTNPPVIHSVKN